MERWPNLRALCAALYLLVLVGLAPLPIAAQVCEDCALIKQRQVEATRLAVATPPTPAPAVRLTLYWAAGCGHCHEVLDGLLPRLQQEYGPQLAVRLVEVVSLEDISAFFAVAEAYGYPRGQASVPFLLIGDRALMGVEQIEQELPGLIAASLAAGGTDWPAPPVGEAASPAAALTDDICGFTTPCAENETATVALSSQQPLILAAAAVLMSALAIGGVFGLRRVRGRAGVESK